MTARSLLTRLEELCNVDVDDADYDFIKSLPIMPHNQTSNQVVLADMLELPRNRPILTKCIENYGRYGWERVFDETSVRICANNVPLITGRVLIQTSPKHLNNAHEIVNQCRRFAHSFEKADINRDRFAIKIPFSGAGASAAKILNNEGIRTLATSVFCLEQAIAASQSQCIFISPYFNAHVDPALRPNVKDSALEHPMSPRIIHMLEAFTKLYKETGEEQPIMVIASHFHPEEFMAMAELGCQHVTIQQPRLRELMESPDTLPAITKPKNRHPYATLETAERLRELSKLDPLAGPEWDGMLPPLDVDYVANSGEKLDLAIEQDAVASKRIQDAMTRFIDAELKAKGIIEAVMKAEDEQE